MIRKDNEAMGAFCCASVTSGNVGNDQDGNEWNRRHSALICTAAACGRFRSSRGDRRATQLDPHPPLFTTLILNCGPSQQRHRSAIVKPSLVVFRLVVALIPYFVDLSPNSNPQLNNTLPLTIFYPLICFCSKLLFLVISLSGLSLICDSQN
ncbi:hypothetical protein BLNAU_21393 [Blattamonas nauphoetae]|uniref:Uncharacterized protein n=1 Tax=Blattamonas nauphoetae TaxID=2049346 RepID=A0ABQ9X083_9EUKA|nr:hypothetical protein BLNAU_21393 [Blattamonas nauphoetae]